MLGGKQVCLSVAVVLAVIAPDTPSAAATLQPTTQSGVAQVNPFAADHRSIDSLVLALYAVISGDAGEKRDWARLRAMFHPDARMIPTGRPSPVAAAMARVISAEQYIAMSGPILERDGFHEQELARRVEEFGHIAHVFSTYESRHKRTDAQPFMRGINSIQLLNDGMRWWVMNVAWSQETPANPIPTKYLSSPARTAR